MPEFLSHGFPLRQESMMLCQASPVALLRTERGIRDLGAQPGHQRPPGGQRLGAKHLGSGAGPAQTGLSPREAPLSSGSSGRGLSLVVAQ